jgi:hypothetical protein
MPDQRRGATVSQLQFFITRKIQRLRRRKRMDFSL